jgi:hypothetical protein
MRLVLDAETVNALLDPRHPAERKVRRAMEAARRLRREVAIATGTLAELYRGTGRNQALDALLDLGRLAGPYRTIVVEPLGRTRSPSSDRSTDRLSSRAAS